MKRSLNKNIRRKKKRRRSNKTKRKAKNSYWQIKLMPQRKRRKKFKASLPDK